MKPMRFREFPAMDEHLSGGRILNDDEMVLWSHGRHLCVPDDDQEVKRRADEIRAEIRAKRDKQRAFEQEVFRLEDARRMQKETQAAALACAAEKASLKASAMQDKRKQAPRWDGPFRDDAEALGHIGLGGRWFAHAVAMLDWQLGGKAFGNGFQKNPAEAYSRRIDHQRTHTALWRAYEGLSRSVWAALRPEAIGRFFPFALTLGAILNVIFTAYHITHGTIRTLLQVPGRIADEARLRLQGLRRARLIGKPVLTALLPLHIIFRCFGEVMKGFGKAVVYSVSGPWFATMEHPEILAQRRIFPDGKWKKDLAAPLGKQVRREWTLLFVAAFLSLPLLPLALLLRLVRTMTDGLNGWYQFAPFFAAVMFPFHLLKFPLVAGLGGDGHFFSLREQPGWSPRKRDLYEDLLR